MFDNAIIRYIAIAGGFVFATCQFVATPPVKSYAEALHAAPGNTLHAEAIVSLAGSNSVTKTQ